MPLKLFFVLAFVTACAAQNASNDKPMITPNPDGTFTIRKEPPKDAKVNAVVIPPQVVVPIASKPVKER
jgi:hypothetical protein